MMYSKRHVRCVFYLACVLFIAGGLSGCLGSRRINPTRYFTLQPQVTVETAPPLQQTLGIRPLFSARAYGLPMTYLDNLHQLGYRDREEWAEPPASMVTRALHDALSATGRFSDVGNAADMPRPDFILTGELRYFYEDRRQTPLEAVVEVRLELRPARMPGGLWAQTLRESEVILSEDAVAFATAMNEAVSRLAANAANAIAAAEPPGDAVSDPSASPVNGDSRNER